MFESILLIILLIILPTYSLVRQFGKGVGVKNSILITTLLFAVYLTVIFLAMNKDYSNLKVAVLFISFVPVFMLVMLSDGVDVDDCGRDFVINSKTKEGLNYWAIRNRSKLILLFALILLYASIIGFVENIKVNHQKPGILSLYTAIILLVNLLSLKIIKIVNGREEVVINKSTLILRFHILGFYVSREYNINEITNIKMVPLNAYEKELGSKPYVNFYYRGKLVRCLYRVYLPRLPVFYRKLKNILNPVIVEKL